MGEGEGVMRRTRNASVAAASHPTPRAVLAPEPGGRGCAHVHVAGTHRNTTALYVQETTRGGAGGGGRRGVSAQAGGAVAGAGGVEARNYSSRCQAWGWLGKHGGGGCGAVEDSGWEKGEGGQGVGKS